MTRDKLLRGHLPDIRLSSVAGETKYCQLSVADGLDLGFTVKYAMLVMFGCNRLVIMTISFEIPQLLVQL